MAASEDLIESTSVPDPLLMNEQLELNAAIGAGELSGPPLAVNGRSSPALLQKREELAQRAALAALTIVVPLRPGQVPDPEEKPADKARFREAMAVFEALPRPEPGEADHLAVPRAQLEALRDFLGRKWAAPSPPPPPKPEAQLAELLGPAPEAHAWRKRDGRFDLEALEQGLQRLMQAEAWAEGQGGLGPWRAPLEARRQAIVAALTARGAVAGAVASPPPPPPRPRPASPPPAPPPPEPPAEPDPAEVAAKEAAAKEARRQAIEALPLAERLARFAAKQAEGLGAKDEEAGFLASSIAVAQPDWVGPETVPWLDAHGLEALAKAAPFALFQDPPPKARLALVRALVDFPGEAELQAGSVLAGKLAAELVRQHPKALGELVAPMPGEGVGRMIAHTLEGLSDEALRKYSAQALQALGRAMGAPTTDELRRQASRLLRLSEGR